MLFGDVCPAYPCNCPEEESTRWQGVSIAIGFVRIACPAARAAFGEPAKIANSL